MPHTATFLAEDELHRLKYLLADQTPATIAHIWQRLYPTELAFYDVYSLFQRMHPADLLSLEPEEHKQLVAAAAFMAALTAAVDGPHAAAAEEPQTSSAECEDV
jgi:hypothetical protein